MKTKIIFLSAIIISVLFTSCQKSFSVIGNRSLSTESRNLEQFDKVGNNGSYEVTIIKDTASFVIIEAESNLIKNIDTYVYNNALIIDSDENLIAHRPMKLEVHTNALQSTELKGSGYIQFEQFNSNDFSAVISGSGYIRGTVESNTILLHIKGSGNIEVDGIVENGELMIDGSGEIRSYNLYLQNCDATIAGSGNLYTYTSNSLDAEIMGSGSIYYKGDPADLNSRIDGSGRIIKQ